MAKDDDAKRKGVGFNCDDYLCRLPLWNKCRLVVDGEEAVKAAAELFLPRLSGQTGASYKAMVGRATFFPATGRTLQAVVGMMFKKPPEFKVPPGPMVDDLMGALSIEGDPATVFSKAVAGELFTCGRVGLLASLPDAVGAAVKPYLAMYRAESICNWKVQLQGSKKVLTMVVLEECEEISVDQFATKEVLQRRVLELVDIGADNKPTVAPVVKVTIWTWIPAQGTSNARWEAAASTYPSVRGAPMKEIPFVVLNTTDLSMETQKPPLLDLVNLNLSHYRTYADLEHGRHFTALPTPWAAGFTLTDPNAPGTKGKELRIGSETAWITDQIGATCGFLEFTGQGLGALEKALETKEQQMAILGGRLLTPDKAQVEAADTQRTRMASENNVVMSIAETMEEGLTMALTWCLTWMAESVADIGVVINKEYMDYALDAPTLLGLQSGVLNGTMSWSTYFYIIQRAGYIPDGRTEDDEKALIDAGDHPPVPPLPPGMEMGPGGLPQPITTPPADKNAPPPKDKTKKPAPAAV